MIDRIDDLIKRFVAVFLFPLINITCIGIIVYVSTKEIRLGGGDYLKNFVKDFFEFMSGILQSSLSSILDFAKDYSTQIQSLTFFLLILFFSLFVILMYVVDRMVYYIGFVLPPGFDFDIDAYWHRSKDSERTAHLRKIIGQEVTLKTSYGILRAYLGEKNQDPYRIAFRNKLISNIESIKTVSRYIRFYVLLSFLLFLASILSTQFSAPKALIVTAVLLTIVNALMLYYARLFRQLVEYDIDSFIWDRCYNQDRKIDAAAVIVASSQREPEIGGRLRSFVRARGLKLSWSEALGRDLTI